MLFNIENSNLKAFINNYKKYYKLSSINFLIFLSSFAHILFVFNEQIIFLFSSNSAFNNLNNILAERIAISGLPVPPPLKIRIPFLNLKLFLFFKKNSFHHIIFNLESIDITGGVKLHMYTGDARIIQS